MKSQEVLDLYRAEGAANYAPHTGKPERLEIKMEHFKVVDYDFTVEFRFDADFGLELVGLSPRAWQKMSRSDVEYLFTSVEKALTEKYGKPTFASDTNLRTERSWMLGSTKIDLALSAYLSLSYTRASVEKGL